ncbi:RNA polymerase sigma factor [Clostridium tertium]|uniref:RNA polymerase sigma factor n=1 Tax=Clostridium tertium TaxID=1559 RepID=UPI00374EA24B
MRNNTNNLVMKGGVIIKNNDKELLRSVKAFKSGDKKSFEIIYKLTYKKVYFFSLSITKDSELTKDIVQEIYVNVFKYIGSLKDEKLFIPWLNQITYNTTKRELGKLSKKPLNITDEEIQTKLIDENNPMLKCIEDESAKELIQSILNLKEKYRTVLILKYFNNYKIKDMAELLHCPEGTIKSRLNTAKEVLKDKLAQKYSKAIVLLGFSFIVSSALTKTAEASVIGVEPSGGKDSLLERKLKNLHISKNFFIGVIMSIIMISIIIASNINKEYREKNATVEYDTGFTNKSIEVSIKINNLEKNDTVKVISTNNEEIAMKKVTEELFLVTIESNGSYNLIINEEIMSNINIDNIDKEAPIVKENNNNGEILELVLSDNLSGVDYDKLEVTLEDNKKINSINVDKSTNKISIDLTKGTKYLKIFDNVGNTSTYRIDIE